MTACLSFHRDHALQHFAWACAQIKFFGLFAFSPFRIFLMQLLIFYSACFQLNGPSYASQAFPPLFRFISTQRKGRRRCGEHQYR